MSSLVLTLITAVTFYNRQLKPLKIIRQGHRETHELVYPGNFFNWLSSIFPSFGHANLPTISPKRFVSCVNEPARRSGLAWDATWRMKQPRLFASSKLAELRSPPVRSPRLTPEKEFVVPVLLWNC
jgi:hypothetical protein